MSKRTLAIALLFGLFAITAPLIAHHSFPMEFDITKPGYMDGKVTKVDWVNPHVEVFIDVTDNKGKTVNWQVEVLPPNVLTRQGWTRDTVKAGTELCVEGYPEKTGKPKFGSTAIVFKATGRVFDTPPGRWARLGEPVPPEVTYTGKTSCSKRK